MERTAQFKILHRKVQVLIMEPKLSTIFVAPLFDQETFLAFAHDTFIAIIEHSLKRLINEENSLEAMTKWLQQSGLVINPYKTEICLFHKRNSRPITIKM
jgi:hypothetical protein